MCWNRRVSLNTFLFSLFGVNFAYFNAIINPYSYLYFLSFISIQLVEYFAWGNLNNKKTIRTLSQIGLFLISIQPVLFIASINNVRTSIKLKVIAMYIVFLLVCLLSFSIDFSMEKASNGHLAWNWLSFPPYVVLLWVVFKFGLLLYANDYLNFVLMILLFLAIYYTYYKTNTWGSLWCWIANLFSATLILVTFYPKFSNYLLFNTLK
jgi:hypothetical protein